MLIVIPNFRRLIAIFCKIYVEKFVVSLFSKIKNKIVIYLTFLFHFCSHEYYQDEVSQQNREPPLKKIGKCPFWAKKPGSCPLSQTSQGNAPLL